MEKKYFNVKVCNFIVIILSLVAIACYFFAPFWSIAVEITVPPELIEEATKDMEDIDINEALGDEEIVVPLSISIRSTDLYKSFFSSSDTAVDTIINQNVSDVVDTVFVKVTSILKTVVKAVARDKVYTEVVDYVRDYLADQAGSEFRGEELIEALEDIGLTQEYIAEKMEDLLDEIFQDGGTTVDALTDHIMDTVETVLEELKENAKNATGDINYDDLMDLELTPESRAEIENGIKEMLSAIAQEDGTIDPNELIVDLIIGALDSEGEGGADLTNALLAEGEGAPEDEQSEKQSAEERLKAALVETLHKYINEDTYAIAVWVFRGMGILMLLSTAVWIYTLIKVIVKMARKGKPFNPKKPVNPTVKLGLPIWLGWLPYLLFAGLPSLALLLIRIPSLWNVIATAAGEEMMAMIARLSISVNSIGWIAALCAAICFGISIYFMVVRRKIKKEHKEKNKKKAPAPAAK